MKITDFIDDIAQLADALAPMMEGTPAGPIIEIGQIVVGLIDKISANHSTDNLEKLEARRAELEPRVMAALDATIKRLG